MGKNYQFQLIFKKNRGKYLIFSLPQTNQYQKITRLTFQPAAALITEKRWGNKIAIFTLNDVVDKIKVSFNFQPMMVKKTIDPQFSLKNYQRKKLLTKDYYSLKPDRFIDGSNIKIKEIAKKVVGQEKNLSQIVHKLYSYVLDYLSYGKPIEGLYPYHQAMEQRTTDCGGFSTFLASLFQSLNIPTRLVVGFLIKKNIIKHLASMLHVSCFMFHDLTMHAWVEIILPDGSFFPLDPSIEWRRKRGLTKKQGGFGFIPDDRLIVSWGEDFKLKVNGKIYQVDLLQNPIYI